MAAPVPYSIRFQPSDRVIAERVKTKRGARSLSELVIALIKEADAR